MYLVRCIGQLGRASIAKATCPRSSVQATLWACWHEVSNRWSVAHVRVKRLFSVAWHSTIRLSLAQLVLGGSTRPGKTRACRESSELVWATSSCAAISEEITSE